MKKSVILVLIASVVISCGNKERFLTSATGSIYECLVVCEEGVQEPICSVLGGDMYGLPQMEPYFTVSHVIPSQFDNYLKSSRNILEIDINPNQYTQTRASQSRDVWSKPQAYIRIQAPSKEELIDYWELNGEQIREWYVREELSRQIRFYRSDTNKSAREKLNKQGYDMLIQTDFMLIMDTAIRVNGQEMNVVWSCNNKGPMRKDLVVWSYPYTAQEQFENESIIDMRNAVLGRLVTAQVPGSHMGTEYKHFPPVTRNVAALQDTIGGFYAAETRGLWKILDGEAMGGPFVSLTHLDQVNGRVVTAEAFLYASGQ